MGLIALLLMALCVPVSCVLAPESSPRLAVLPGVPGIWSSELGDPQWLFRWYGPDGAERSLLAAGQAAIDLPDAFPAPVFAYPCWPDRGILPGVFRPAGAVVPFDVRDGRVVLSWRGGAAAHFFEELLLAGGPENRRPEYFDWPRFRVLLESDSVDPAARDDPWTVDWRTVAIRTRVSGFDARRIKPRETLAVCFPSPGVGPWLGTSPFAAFPIATADGSLRLEASEEPDSLVSPEGVFRFTSTASAWFPVGKLAIKASLDKGQALGYTLSYRSRGLPCRAAPVFRYSPQPRHAAHP